MLAHELYRRALATLAEVESLHAHSRQLSYQSLRSHPQCALLRRCVHFHAPDRVSSTVFSCNPVGVPERSDLIQVGERAIHRQPTTTGGEWKETKPVLTTPGNLPTLIIGWMGLPSTDPTTGGVFSTTAFFLPTVTTITLDGREWPVLAFPVETQSHPRLYFPGDPVPRGGAPRSIFYRGEYRRPTRIAEKGTLFVNARSARPLRYVATTNAWTDDDASVMLARTHVRFRYTSDTVIVMPSLERPV